MNKFNDFSLSLYFYSQPYNRYCLLGIMVQNIISMDNLGIAASVGDLTMGEHRAILLKLWEKARNEMGAPTLHCSATLNSSPPVSILLKTPSWTQPEDVRHQAIHLTDIINTHTRVMRPTVWKLEVYSQNLIDSCALFSFYLSDIIWTWKNFNIIRLQTSCRLPPLWPN